MNDELKNIALTGHSRYRPSDDFTGNMIMTLAAYCILPKKPTIAAGNFERAIRPFLNLPNSH